MWSSENGVVSKEPSLHVILMGMRSFAVRISNPLSTFNYGLGCGHLTHCLMIDRNRLRNGIIFIRDLGLILLRALRLIFVEASRLILAGVITPAVPRHGQHTGSLVQRNK
jgi:hypothetical protein